MGLFGGINLIKGRIDRVHPTEIRHGTLFERGLVLQIRHPILPNVFVVIPLKFVEEYIKKMGEDPFKVAKEELEKELRAVEEKEQREFERVNKEKNLKKKEKIRKNYERSSKERKLISKRLNSQLAIVARKNIKEMIDLFVGRRLRLVIK